MFTKLSDLSTLTHCIGVWGFFVFLNIHTGILRRAWLAGFSVGVLCAGAAAFRLGHRSKQRPNALASLEATVAGTAHVSVCFGHKQRRLI